MTTLAEHGTSRPTRQAGLPSSGRAAVFAEVMRGLDRGLTPDRIARELGVPDDVVALALDHGERVGIVMRPAGGSPCRTGCPTGPEKPLGCYGCPFAR